MFATAANDTAAAELEGPPEPPSSSMTPPVTKENDKAPTQEREPKKTQHRHGRPKFRADLERIPGATSRVSEDQRICPKCKRPTKTVCFKTTEKLTVKPCEFVVEQDQVETCSCGKCHAYIVTATKPDEVVPRGVLGNELLVQALVEHYDTAVPWERMQETARQQDVPLSANTLAASVGAAIDRFEPVVDHIKEKALASSYTALDATSMKVLDQEHPLGIRTGSLWLVEGDHQYAYFIFAKTAEAKHIDDLLAGRTLASVMCDGSATNNCVERVGGQRGGCNAHYPEGIIIRRPSRNPLANAGARGDGLVITTGAQSDERNARRSGVGRHRPVGFRERPARRQKAVSTSRFSFTLVLR
jgi:transposase